MLDYEGLTVRDLKRIVNRGEATPAAIGLFVLYDFWEREHGRRAIVDNKLLRYIESKWAYSPYANELDYWLEFGGDLRILELQAIKQGLTARLRLQDAEYLIAQTLHWFYEDFYTQLVKQAEPLGIDIREHRDLLSKGAALSKNLPSAGELGAVEREIRAHVAFFLGYLSAIGAAETMLGVPLTEEIKSNGVALSTWVEEQEARSEKFRQLLEEYWPDKARELRRLTAISSVEPSPDTIMSVDRILIAYLSPNWRAWARAGVNLRELADTSKGIADLMRHAELAAVEFDNE